MAHPLVILYGVDARLQCANGFCTRRNLLIWEHGWRCAECVGEETNT